MDLIAEIRRRARHVIGPALGLFAIGYFAYHAIHGDRGFVAWRQLEEAVAAARAELATVEAERRALDHRVGRLRPEGLDADLLEEAVRHHLGFGDPKDVVIPTKRESAE
jgi:cell division protein FtsB